ISLPKHDNDSGGFSAAASLPNHFEYSLVVDDVIFSGYTMLHSLEVVRQQIETKVLRTAVLIDRGHRKVPVEANFFGMKLPTKLNEHVRVCLDEHSLDKVILTTGSKQYN